MRAHPSVSDMEWGRRITKGKYYAWIRRSEGFVPQPKSKTNGWIEKCSEIFRRLQSHILPANSVNTKAHGPEDGHQPSGGGDLFDRWFMVGLLKLHYLVRSTICFCRVT